MKIGYIGTAQVPSRAANSIQLMKVASALAGNGHSVKVWVPGQRERATWEDLSAHYGLRDRFEIVWLPEVSATRRYLFCLRAVLRARGWGADLIYTRALQAAAISSGLGHPTILELHGPPTGRFGPSLFRLAVGGSGFRRLIPTTRQLAAMLKGHLRRTLTSKEVLILPNGVDLEPYQELGSAAEVRKTLGWPEMFTAGYTGHLYPGRGADLMFDLAVRSDQIRFVWVGGSPETIEFWREKAEERGVKNLDLLGFEDQRDMPALQSACDVLLAPYGVSIAGSGGGDSSAYASPMKVVEYMAAGRAILCSDLPVIRELLDENNALLLPPGDLGSWHAGLEEVYGQPEVRARLSSAARRRAQELSWQSRQEKALEGITL